MSTKNQALKLLKHFEIFGFSFPVTGSFYLNFMASDGSPEISGVIQLRSLEHFYLINALAETKGIELYEEKYKDHISYYMPSHHLTFIYWF